MNFRIVITKPAERDIRDCVLWWSSHRSREQAARWSDRVFPAIDTLKQSPERCPVCPETDLLGTGLRQLDFGIGRHPTHRIAFTVDGDEVRILRVRHAAQQDLTLEDIS